MEKNHFFLNLACGPAKLIDRRPNSLADPLSGSIPAPLSLAHCHPDPAATVARQRARVFPLLSLAITLALHPLSLIHGPT